MVVLLNEDLAYFHRKLLAACKRLVMSRPTAGDAQLDAVRKAMQQTEVMTDAYMPAIADQAPESEGVGTRWRSRGGLNWDESDDGLITYRLVRPRSSPMFVDFKGIMGNMTV